MLHYERVFGNVFERSESKCCGVLMKHLRKVKGEEMITLQMAKQLKTKNINAVPGELFQRQCKAKFSLETDSLFGDQDTVQTVTDTGNEFTEFEIPRKKVQSIGISPASLNGSMKTLKSDILEAYKVKKLIIWLGCTRKCKKNKKQHNFQNKSKFLPRWLINGLECAVQNILMSLNTLFELYLKSKKQVQHQQNLRLKKGKQSRLKHFIW